MHRKRSYSGVLAAAAAAAFAMQAALPAAAAGQGTDAVTAERVKAALANDHELAARQHIQVSVAGGIVRLSGVVESEQDLRLAELDAKSVPGVTGVANHIELKSGRVDGSH